MKDFELQGTTISDAEKIRRLAHCTFLPGSWDKRFIRDMESKRCSGDLKLTEKQEEQLDRCFYRYRRQLEKFK